MSIIPPLFTSFGKNSADLFKKKYESDPLQFKTIRKAQNGLTIETGAVNVADKDKPSALRGFTKFSLNKLPWGTGEVELHTDAKQVTKVSTKFTKLFSFPLTLQATLASIDKHKYFADDNYNKNKPVASVEATYNRDHFNGQVTVKSNTVTHRAEFVASGGYDKYAIGASLALNSTSLNQILPNDLQAGAEYSQDDLTVSAYSNYEKEKDKDGNDDVYTSYNVSAYHRVNRELVVGGRIKNRDIDFSKTELTFGSDYKLDQDTSVRGKVIVPKGLFAFSLEHRLQSPQLLFGLSSEFNVQNPLAPTPGKFGVSFTVGDF